MDTGDERLQKHTTKKPQESRDGDRRSWDDCEAEEGRLVASGATTGSLVDGDATSNREDLAGWKTATCVCV